MDRHRIPFKYAGPDDDDAILLVSNLVVCEVHVYVIRVQIPSQLEQVLSLLLYMYQWSSYICGGCFSLLFKFFAS